MPDFEPVIPALGIAVAVYLVGAINTSILACRFRGIGDPRLGGSKNPGATNLLRTTGWRVAAPVLAIDVAKAAAAILAVRLVGQPELAPLMVLPLLLGNLFPVFHKFRGGKGVAAAVGAFLAIAPISALLGGVVFAMVTAISKRVSLGSLAMVTSYPVSIWILQGQRNALLSAVAVAGMIFFTHRENIRRLAQGREPAFGRKKEADK